MGISIWQLLIVLLIVLLLFGAKRLRTLGTDLGTSIKGFRQAMKEGETTDDEETTKKEPAASTASSQGRIIEGEATRDEAAATQDMNKEKHRV